MIGSVFSPYYASARRRGATDPLDFCGLNVALYSGRRKRWSLTERGRSALQFSSSFLAIGPSALSWDRDALTIEIREVTVPLPRKILGTVRLYPEALMDYQAPLDAKVLHRWCPIAPCARVEVEMSRPDLKWKGAGYFDSNAGDEPLETAFRGWNWSRAPRRGGTSVLYHVDPREGAAANLALHFDAAGRVTELDPPSPLGLPRTRIWRVERATHADAGQPATVIRTLEDTPFYSRSILASRLQGDQVTAVHESLSLDRFRRRWVQMLLPFRMPRSGA